MKKAIFLLLFITQWAFCQEILNTLNINLDKTKSINLVNDTDKKGSVLILGKKDRVSMYKLDNQFNILNQFEHIEEDKSGDFLGNSFKDNKLYTYWEKNNKTIVVHEIDFSNNSLVKNELSHPIESNEKIMTSFSQNNLHYIVTVTKRTNIVNIHIFDGVNFERKMIDLYKLYFINSLNRRIQFWDYLNDENGVVYLDKFQTIFLNEKHYNAVYATEKKKIYVDDDRIIFSSDINDYYTQFVTISLKDFKESSQIISYNEEVANAVSSKKTNSFVIDNKVFIVKIIKNQIDILIKSFENESLKTITINATSGQEYINSELTQEFSTMKSREFMNDQEKFLKKIYNKNPSISGYLEDGNYHLTVGGVSYPKQQSVVMFGVFGLVGGIAYAIMSNNNNRSSVLSYSDKDITYFKSIISAHDFRSSKIRDTDNRFDLLRLHIENNNAKENILDLYTIDNSFYLLTETKKEDKVLVYKF